MSSFVVCRGDARSLPFASGTAHTCVSSPPYFGLRDYGVAGQLGLESTPEEYVSSMVEVFREVKRVLRDDGTLWLNIGDTYTTGASTSDRCSDPKAVGDVSRGLRRIGTPEGLKPKDLIGIPWMLAFALRADGWYLRSDIIWHKPNPMPESVTDRPTKAHEYLFLLTKSARYYYDAEAIAEGLAESSIERLSQPTLGAQEGSTRANGGRKTNGNMKAVGSLHMQDTQRNDGDRWRTADGGVAARGTRNKRSVWSVVVAGFKEAHFATFPEALIEPCILAGSPIGGTVLDPFTGSGTTGVVAIKHGRNFIGTELNPEYAVMARRRIGDAPLSLFGAA